MDKIIFMIVLLMVIPASFCGGLWIGVQNDISELDQQMASQGYSKITYGDAHLKSFVQAYATETSITVSSKQIEGTGYYVTGTDGKTYRVPTLTLFNELDVNGTYSAWVTPEAVLPGIVSGSIGSATPVGGV